MFSLIDLKRILKEDNPQYERVLQSELHEVVSLLSKNGFGVQTVATAMRKVPADKWKKYPKTWAYLLLNINSLPTLLKVKLVKFKTKSLEAMPGGNVKHDAVWESDSGNLQDLSYLFVREKVYWGAASATAAPLLNPAYRVPGQHFGMGNAATSPGSAGYLTDTHDYIGAYLPTILNYTGVPISYVCDQVYQYTDDNKVTWKDIPSSNFQITRTVTPQPGGKVRFNLLKTNLAPNNVVESKSNTMTV